MNILSESTGTSEQVWAQFFFAFACCETIGIFFATVSAFVVAMRCFSAEHRFVFGNFASAFGDSYANGRTGRLFFATGDERQCSQCENPEERVAGREQHSGVSRPDWRAVVNGDELYRGNGLFLRVAGCLVRDPRKDLRPALVVLLIRGGDEWRRTLTQS